MLTRPRCNLKVVLTCHMDVLHQVSSEALLKACPIPFHEGRLWKGKDAPALREQLQASFQNITSIMDCVGCEKCKLWGKLQLLGKRLSSCKLLLSIPMHALQPQQCGSPT